MTGRTRLGLAAGPEVVILDDAGGALASGRTGEVAGLRTRRRSAVAADLARPHNFKPDTMKVNQLFCFTSLCTRVVIPAKTAVAAPSPPASSRAAGACSSSGAA